MILGVGTDLVEVARIESGYQKFGELYLNRILRAEEARYCLSNRRPGPFIAARFAAKEAVSKAFGTGIGALLGWHDVEVARKESGQPFIILHGQGLALMREQGGARIHLSLAHTEN